MRWRGVLLSLLCLAPLGESTDRLSRFWSANLGAETSPLYKWSVTSAGIFVAVALVLSVYLIFEHLAAYNKPEEQKFLVGLILMVPVYGVESCLCSDCAKELRLQSNMCLVCHQPIEELLEIKVDEGFREEVLGFAEEVVQVLSLS